MSELFQDLPAAINPNLKFTPLREPKDNGYTETVRSNLDKLLSLSSISDFGKRRISQYLMDLYSIGNDANQISLEFIRVAIPQRDLSFSIFDSDFAEPLEHLFRAESKKLSFGIESDSFYQEWKNEMREHYK